MVVLYIRSTLPVMYLEFNNLIMPTSSQSCSDAHWIRGTLWKRAWTPGSLFQAEILRYLCSCTLVICSVSDQSTDTVCRAQTHVFALSYVCLNPPCVYSLPFCTCIVLWISGKVIRLPVSAESQSLCSVQTSCSPLHVISDRILSLDGDVPPSFIGHALTAAAVCTFHLMK